ncbi:MAG: glycosyltransferase [Flavobacteriaceae bacterium]|nr:glycosyltransferase [Flavobacteriaceae bacterium]|tara:strand:- start:500 stop:1333 length:834 start_codon:yes stop_codon:yes gene_type:complete
MSAFSIIIPTYNSEETLSLSLASIANQTCKDVEVLIMDGASTDRTVEIATSFKKSISKLLIYSEKDEGIYDAMNKAMQVATGDWLLFMGSDDSFYNNRVLEKVSEKIKETNANVIYGNAKIIGDTGWAKDGDIYDGVFSTKKLLKKNICHQAMFYNTHFVKEKIGYFNLNYTKSSDWDFNLRCWAKQPFEYIPVVVANFYAGGFSSNSSDAALVDDFVNNVCEYFSWSLFHPFINNSNFIFYKQVQALQKEKHPNRLAFLKLKKRVVKKLKSYFGIL